MQNLRRVVTNLSLNSFRVINEKTKVAFRVFSATSRGDGEWGISEDSGLDSTSSGSTGLIREHFDGNRMPETCVLPKQDQEPGARGSYLHKQNPNRRRCNLEQFVASNTDTDFIDFSVTEMKNVLRDVIVDIARYHYSERCHGNVSLETITVIKGDRCYGVLETPVTGTRTYDYCKYGIQGDIYALGCVIYFCIVKGDSPFLCPQDWEYDKFNEIIHSKNWSMDLLAKDLFEAIFASFPSSTLSPNDVEQHPFFWLESEKNRMLVETSDFLVAIHNTARYGVSLVELSKFQNDLATIATSEVLPDKEWFHKIKEVAQIKDGKGLQTLLKEYRNCFPHLSNYPIKAMAIIRGESEEQISRLQKEALYKYYMSRFPCLVIGVYKLLRRHPRLATCMMPWWRFKVDLGQRISAADLRNSDISGSIASNLRELHLLEIPSSIKKVKLWKIMRELLHTAQCKCTKEDIKEFSLDTLKEEIKMLKNEISHDSQEVRRCHNDLQYGNIAIDKDGTITLLNYECSTHNPVAYDIANHFCEMVANYHSETPHVLDYSKYPDLKERRRFITIYLSHGEYFPTDAQVERLLNDVEKYTLASHLLWCLWGIISNYLEVIEFDQEGYQRKMFIVEVTDFDYMEYARQRFQQYQLRKRELLGSSGISP